MEPGIATLVPVLLAALGFWLRPFIQRWVQKRYEYKYLVCELEDIVRHLGANITVLEAIAKDGKIPAPMHINKLKIPETSAIFSIETLKLADFRYSSRLYDLRLKLRNLNIEIDDLLAFSNHCYDPAGFFEIVSYHRDKSQAVRKILAGEVRTLKNQARAAPQESATPLTIIARPAALAVPPAAMQARPDNPDLIAAAGCDAETGETELGIEADAANPV